MASQHKFALHYFIIKPNLDIPCLKDLSFNKCYEENTHTLCIFSLVLVFEFLVFWVVTKTQTTASINMSIFVCQNFSKQTKMIYRSDCLISSHSVSNDQKLPIQLAFSIRTPYYRTFSCPVFWSSINKPLILIDCLTM